jgi:hypothetical protein
MSNSECDIRTSFANDGTHSYRVAAENRFVMGRFGFVDGGLHRGQRPGEIAMSVITERLEQTLIQKTSDAEEVQKAKTDNAFTQLLGLYTKKIDDAAQAAL